MTNKTIHETSTRTCTSVQASDLQKHKDTNIVIFPGKGAADLIKRMTKEINVTERLDVTESQGGEYTFRL